MKKHGLLKILGAILVLVMIASFALSGEGGAKTYLAIGDIMINGFNSLYHFFYIILFVLSIGGFYGILNKVPAYKKLLDNIVLKVKPFGKKTIFLTILVFALVTSLTGMTLPLLIFVPFITSIILLLGYDKLVAITSTIVSMLVGYIGGVFVTIYNQSAYGMTTYEEFVGTASKFSNVFPKLLLLFAGITLLIYFVNNHIKDVEKKKVKYELNDDSEVMINEVTSNYRNIYTWPILLVLVLLFVILTLGLVPWYNLFEIEIFNTFHTWLTELSLKEFAIVPSIISSNLLPFGQWYAKGDPWAFIYICLILLVFTLITALIGKVKFDDAIDAYTDGMKKMLPTATLILVALTVLICVSMSGVYQNILLSHTKFNYGISSILLFLGCLLHVDTYYIIGGVFSPILNLITDETVYSSVAVLFQGIYGIFNIVGPTSIILIFALSYMNVPYTTWLKYIWRFVLGLIILLALVTLLVVLL